MTYKPNAPPAADQLIVSEYEFHKYVFCPALNEGLKYGKGETVSFERLGNDLLQNKQNRAKFRSFAYAICDGCNAQSDDHQ